MLDEETGFFASPASRTDLFNQVFMNILGNAIDSLENRPAPKTIAISTALVAR